MGRAWSMLWYCLRSRCHSYRLPDTILDTLQQVAKRRRSGRNAIFVFQWVLFARGILVPQTKRIPPLQRVIQDVAIQVEGFGG
jgi:hypothetical protein